MPVTVEEIRPVLDSLYGELAGVQLEQLCRVWAMVDATYTLVPDGERGFVEDPDMAAARAAGLVLAAEFLLGRVTLAEVDERLLVAAYAFDEADRVREEAGGPGSDAGVDRRYDAACRALDWADVAKFAVGRARAIKHMRPEG